jgi:hypothetical protein
MTKELDSIILIPHRSALIPTLRFKARVKPVDDGFIQLRLD